MGISKSFSYYPLLKSEIQKWIIGSIHQIGNRNNQNHGQNQKIDKGDFFNLII